ncbi:MAG: OmpA family protein [Polyangiales bacterium]
MRFSSFVATLAALTSCLPFGRVLADSNDLGFAVQRFDPAERGSDWFALDSLDLRGDARTAVGLTADYARKPLILRDAEGERALLENQLIVHAAMSVVFRERLRLGLDVPFAPFVSGTSGGVYRVEEGPAMGDIRLSADVRLVGEYGSPFTAAFGAAVWFPTGNYAAFTGDGKARVGPRLAIAGTKGLFQYAARLAYDYRARDDLFAGTRLGGTLGYGAALGVRAGKVLIGPEIYGTSIAKGFSRAGTAIEAVLGVHYVAESFRFGVGAGPGLTDGLGSPELRGLASFEWVSRNGIKRAPVDTRSDRDGDKIPDFSDACPDKVGVPESDPPGCPLSDGDGDGVADSLDACPFVAGKARSDATTNGCPNQDRDADGVQDASDACPDVAGRATADTRTSGCADSDGDSVFDPVDACPRDHGVANLDPAKSGCPVLGQPEPTSAPSAPPAPSAPVASTGGDASITESVQFQRGKSDMVTSGADALERVRQTLLTHPEITLVSVEGHTDSEERKGRAQMRLSKKRVADVLAWLNRAGIDSARLIGHGFGAERPVAPNLTEQGRAQNRRVELHVLEVNHRPVGKE